MGERNYFLGFSVMKGIGPKKFDLLSRNFGNAKEEQKIIDLLTNESLQFDEIVHSLKLDSAKTATLLSLMEMKGIVKSTEGNFSLAN